jgi:hypothetical protein
MTARARIAAAALLASAMTGPAAANDTVAELRPGGLVFVTTDAVAMESEDLFLSLDEVRVDYVFRNTTDLPQAVVVAFPMPALDGSPWVIPAVPDAASANFLDFTVTVDGRPVEPRLQQRAEVAGIDVTADLLAAGVPLEPFSEGAVAAVGALDPDRLHDFLRRGLVVIDTYDDDGTGMKDHVMPFWTLRTTFHWEMTFQPGVETRVSHRYRPSVGMTAGLAFRDYDRFAGPVFDDYVRRYCMDDAFLSAVRRREAAAAPGEGLFENRIAYVLTTGGNWAGPIRRFRLTVDKGSPDNLVSFCADGVTKTGPTTFTVAAEDFMPERDLEVLILAAPR